MKKIISLILVASFMLIPTGIKAEDNNNSIAQYYNDRIQYYESFNVQDPNFVTDEELFGKWDGSGWEIPSLLDYDRYSGLSEVELCAKNGDYSGAKAEILEYYRMRLKSDKRADGYSRNSRNWRLWGEMLMEGMVGNTSSLPLDRISLNDTYSWYSSNVVELLTTQIASTPYFNIQILDPKKDGYRACFATKENTNKPYIRLVVNGAERIYYPIADTTIRGGKYYYTTYGSDEYMYSNESYTTIGTELPIDDYTSRACLLFNFNDLKADDKINSAYLYLYGRMEEDDNPIRPEEEKDSIDLYVVHNTQTTFWNEAQHSFSTESVNNFFSHDGEFAPSMLEPTDVSTSWRSLVASQSIPDYLCRLYRGMKEEAYLYHAIRFTINSILQYGTNYRQIKQPCFNAAIRTYTFCQDIYTMIESQYMTPEYFTIMLKWIYMQTQFLVTDWCSEEEPNNIGTICTRGLLEGAMTFREFKAYSDPKTHLADSSLPGSMQGGWLEVGLFRSLYKLRQTVHEDGTSVEIPMGYVNVNLGDFYEPYGLAEKLGLREELMSGLEENDIELLRKTVYFAAAMVPPTHGSWVTGDANNWKSPAGQWLADDLSFFIKNDSVLEWLKSGGENGNSPSGFTSYANDNVQQAVLRSSWSKNAVALYTDADSAVGSHGHSDDLAIQIIAYGEYLLSDAGTRDYTMDATTNWQVSTRAHNTIEINSCSQAGNDANKSNPSAPTEEPFGEPLYWPNDYGFAQGRGTLHPETRVFGNIYDYMRAETTTYKGLNILNGDFTVWRDILFVKPGYFIVTDYIEPENSDVNTYKQAWHFNKNTEFVVDEETKVASTLSGDKANILVVPVDTDEITPVRRTGRYTSDVTFDQEYLTYNKQKQGITTYNTILYPTQAGENYEIIAKPAELDVSETVANAFEADIVEKKTGNTKNVAYYTLFDNSQKQLRKFGEYETDGSLAFVEKDSSGYSSFILQGGKNLSVHGAENLIENGNEISSIGVSREGSVLNIQTKNPEELDYGTLKIYMKNRINAIYVNDMPLQYFEQVGNYVYFRETGLTDSENSGSQTGEQSPAHGGGSGGGSAKPSEEKENDTVEKDEVQEIITEPFADVNSHWAEEYILLAQKENLVMGDGSGNFNPDKTITRAEMLTMFMRAIEGEATYNGEFGDVAENDWYAESVALALETGIISNGAKFRPNDLITREEMCKIAVGIFEILENDVTPLYEVNYSDKSDISEWALEFVGRATQSGLMDGIGNNQFMPKGSATRAQAVAILVRMLKLKEGADYENQTIGTNR